MIKASAPAWIASSSRKEPEPLDSAQCAAYRGHQLTGVKGVIRSTTNPTFDCEINPVAGEKDTTAMLNADHIEETVEEKSGRANYVTACDKKVQAFLFDRLAGVFPDAELLSLIYQAPAAVSIHLSVSLLSP